MRIVLSTLATADGDEDVDAVVADAEALIPPDEAVAVRFPGTNDAGGEVIAVASAEVFVTVPRLDDAEVDVSE